MDSGVQCISHTETWGPDLAPYAIRIIFLAGGVTFENMSVFGACALLKLVQHLVSGLSVFLTDGVEYCHDSE